MRITMAQRLDGWRVKRLECPCPLPCDRGKYSLLGTHEFPARQRAKLDLNPEIDRQSRGFSATADSAPALEAREFPAISLHTREIEIETGSTMTACTATQCSLCVDFSECWKRSEVSGG